MFKIPHNAFAFGGLINNRNYGRVREIEVDDSRTVCMTIDTYSTYI